LITDHSLTLIPVNAGGGAFEYCFLDKLYRAAFRFYDNGFLGFLIKLEDLRTDILATATTYTFLFIDKDSFLYFNLSSLILLSLLREQST
jgi:hypothetical protein